MLTDLGVPAVMLNGSKITFRNNILTGSSYGITILGSSNIISENTIECILQIQMDNVNLNIISMNKISGPVRWVGQDPFTGNEGIALFNRCSNNLIFGNNITGFVNQAIKTVFSCTNTPFYGNFMENNGFAIALQDGAINNTFYDNTFTADSCKIQINEGVKGTLWDNGTIVNCWGDYIGIDTNGDGIGDAPYIVYGYKWNTSIDGFESFVSGQDNYPLINSLIIPEFSSWMLMFMGFFTVSVVLIASRNGFKKKLGKNEVL
jgi:parallel beta-helix repeat protein